MIFRWMARCLNQSGRLRFLQKCKLFLGEWCWTGFNQDKILGKGVYFNKVSIVYVFYVKNLKRVLSIYCFLVILLGGCGCFAMGGRAFKLFCLRNVRSE